MLLPTHITHPILPSNAPSHNQLAIGKPVEVTAGDNIFNYVNN